MAVTIEQEPNDLLLVKLLGIKHVSVYFNDLDTNFPAARVPSAVDVFTDTDRDTSPAEDEAVIGWAARKFGVDPDDVVLNGT